MQFKICFTAYQMGHLKPKQTTKFIFHFAAVIYFCSRNKEKKFEFFKFTLFSPTRKKTKKKNRFSDLVE